MRSETRQLDSTLDAGKLFHPVTRGILLLENSALNGSEVSAVLATQENSYEYDRVISGLEEQWPNHRLFRRDRDTRKATHITAMAGLLNLLPTSTS